jgi:hypothetical protein
MDTIDIKIAEARARGESLKSIGSQVGMSHVAVLKRASKDEVRNIIEDLHEKLITESLGTAVSNIKHSIDQYKLHPVTDQDIKITLQLRDHGFKASQRLMETAGILPVNAPTTTYIQQINQQNNYQVSGAIGEILTAIVRNSHTPESLLDTDIIDVEPDGQNKGQSGASSVPTRSLPVDNSER